MSTSKKIITICIVVSASAVNAFHNYAQMPAPEGPGPITSISSPPPGSPLAGPDNSPQPNVDDNMPAVPSPPPPAGWGYTGYLTPPPGDPDWTNSGTINVMATGYDSEGVMKQIPMVVSYRFNGVTYDVLVVNAWNPYTYGWDNNVDEPAYSTTYFMNGFTYNYYTVLSIGTFYFNL